MTATNITQSARILGINKSTLILALKSFPATPVGMKGFRSSPVPVYDVEQIRECYDQYKAQVEANRHRAKPSLGKKNAKYKPCTRCGRPDTCNDVRDGLCFDCYCHDHGKPFDKTGFVAIWDAVRANARDAAAKNGATSKKTGTDRGKRETREECAENDVNERAEQ